MYCVGRQNKLEKPKEKGEFNKRESTNAMVVIHRFFHFFLLFSWDVGNGEDDQDWSAKARTQEGGLTQKHNLRAALQSLHAKSQQDNAFCSLPLSHPTNLHVTQVFVRAGQAKVFRTEGEDAKTFIRDAQV